MTAQNENDMEITAEQFVEKDYMSANFLVSISGVKYSEGLFKTIHEIDMPVRAHNAFVKANITYLGDLGKIPY